MLPILDGAGEIVTWEISPQLPTGLNFSSDDGSISGIATKLSIRKQYTVWANNSGGSSMARFNITVVDQVPTDIGYNYEILVLTRNDSNEGILPLSPNLVGPGEITSWDSRGLSGSVTVATTSPSSTKLPAGASTSSRPP